MSDPVPATAGRHSAVARYEELRHSVLTGATGSRHYGVIVLVREGLAGWLAHEPAPSAAVQPAAALSGRPTAPLMGDEVQQRLVGMLATMALASRTECRP